MTVRVTTCIHCQNKFAKHHLPQPQYQAHGANRHAIKQILFRNVDVTKDCFGAQPGLGSYGYIWMFVPNANGLRFLCSMCGENAASVMLVGDTRVELKV